MPSWNSNRIWQAVRKVSLAHSLPPFSRLFFAGVILYFALFWMQAFHLDSAGNLLAGHEHIWGDGAAHLTMISTFAYRTSWPTQSPLLIGNTFGYPYAVNLLSGLLAKTGVSVFFSFTFLSFLLCVGGVYAVYRFAYYLLKKHSLAVVTTTLYFCNGGMGWYYYVQSIATSMQPLQAALNPFGYSTHSPERGLDYINIIHSMLLAQRAFTLSLPIGVGLLYIFHRLFVAQKLTTLQKSILIVGIGFLPLIHTHTFLSFILIMPIWTVWELGRHLKKKDWQGFWALLQELLIIGSCSIVLGLIVIMYLLKPNVGENFVRWQPGWYSVEHHMSWLWYWFLNWGFAPYTALAGLYFFVQNSKNRHSVGFILGCIAAFILSNLFIWQPNIFDNSKIFAWTSLGASLMSSYLLYILWKKKTLIGKSISILLFVVLIFSGALDVYRVARTDLHSYVMFTAEELQLAEWVKNNTAEDSIWLTSDRHNNWVYNLTGRQVLMAYRGWLWTHGYNYKQIEADMSLMFQYPSNYEHIFNKYNVTHISLGTHEIHDWKANKREFLENFTVLYATQNYTILGRRP